MDFDLSEDQALIRDSLDRMLRDRYSFHQRQRYASEPAGWSRERWNDYADIGLLGLPFGEAYGGLAGSPVDTMIIMEAFGRALVLEPYLSTVVLAGGALRYGGNEPQRQALLPRIIAGEITLSLAHHERDA